MFKQKIMKFVLCGIITMSTVIGLGILKTPTALASSTTTWLQPVTKDEIGALRHYSDEGYVRINWLLRLCSLKFDTNAVELMDSAFEKSRASNNMVVYRYVSEKQFMESFGSTLKLTSLDLESPESLKDVSKYIIKAQKLVTKWINKDLTDKGYTSTSIKKVKEFSDRPIRLEIEVPKGAAAIDMDRIAVHKDEHELLLPRGSKINITGANVISNEITKKPLLVIKAKLINKK